MATESSSTPSMSFPAGDVVKQGYLFVKRPPRKYFSKIKAWHKRYFVLRDETQEHCPQLEMYEKNELLTAPLGLTGPKLILDLGQCVHIGFTSDSSRFPYALVVVCQGRSPLLLAAEDELGARSWLLALGLITHKGTASNQTPKNTALIRPPPILRDDSFRSVTRSKIYDRESQSAPSSESTEFPEEYIGCNIDISFAREIFLVTVQPTETSERLAICGDLQLVIFSHGVGLAKPSMTECFVIWPVAYIRQYQHESVASAGRSKTTLVTLEVGRRSATGEGVFQFKTQRGQQIIRELKSIVELWCARKAILSLQQSSSKNSLADSTFQRNFGTPHNHQYLHQHRSQQWNTSGRSAPCTPSLAFPHNWQKRWSSPSQHKRQLSEYKEDSRKGKDNAESSTRDKQEDVAQTEVDSDVNYIIPAFENESDNEEEDEITPKNVIELQPSPVILNPCVTLQKHDGQHRGVTAAVGKDGCVRTKQTRILGAQSLCLSKNNSLSPEEECSYVEIIRKDSIIPESKPSSECLVTSQDDEQSKVSDIKMEEDPKAYLEVLPT